MMLLCLSLLHVYNSPVIKTIHYTINITFTEVELFAIRYGLNQASCLANIKCIVVITDSIHAAKKIFDPFIYPY